MSEPESVSSALDEAEPEVGSGDATGDAPRPRLVRFRLRVRRVGRDFGRVIAFFALSLVLAAVVLVQTGQGQDFVLRAALGRVHGALAGELVIDGIRSGTLLAGATLTDVRLDAADGRAFLQADSVVVRYSLFSLLVGANPIRSTTIWGLDVELSQYAPGELMNVSGVLRPASPDSTESGARSTNAPFSLGRLAVREGRVRILTPGAENEGQTLERGPDGQTLRVLAFLDLDLDLEDAVLIPGAAVSFEARLASFSSEVSILRDPLVVREAFGRIEYGALGIRVTNAAFRLPSTLARGDLRLGPPRPGEPWTLRTELASDGWGELSDIAWVDPRIPDGRFRGGADISIEGGVLIDFHQLEVELEASNVVADGRVRFAKTMSMESIEVTASPITLERLEPWLQVEFPLEGWLSGKATFSGTLENISSAGRVTLVPKGLTGTPTTVNFSGTIHRGEGAGASDFEARMFPLNYSVLEALWPGFPWAGTGDGRVEISGRIDDGLQIVSDLTHQSTTALTSRVALRGLLWRGESDGWVTDFRGEVQPLAVGLLAGLAPDLGLRGTLAGPISFAGPLQDLDVEAELMASSGRVSLKGTVNLMAPASSYNISVEADSLSIASLTSRVPDGTEWSGRLDVDGSGFALDSMDVTAAVVARESRFGVVRIDSVSTLLRARNGVLATDSVFARIAGITATGDGSLGLVAGRFGVYQVEFSAPSLVGLRPLLMGLDDSVLVRDGLDALEMEFLRLDGIEPDTLPSARDVRLEGVMEGFVSLSGQIREFSLGAVAEVFDGRYQQNELDTVRLGLSVTGSLGVPSSWQLGGSAVGILWEGREFDQGGVEAVSFDGVGQGRVELVRRPGEAYRVAGVFSGDPSEGEVQVTEASVQVNELVWSLGRSAQIRWDTTTVRVDSLRISRPGANPMSMVADGTLTRGGESDFYLTVEGLHLDRLMHVAQLDDLAIGGELDLNVTVHGAAEAPSIESAFGVDDPRYGAIRLTRVEGSMDFDDLLATVQIDGWENDRVVIDAAGTLPLDLAFTGVEERILDAPMAMIIVADSLDAAIALSYVTSLQNVVGRISGEVEVGGTPLAPEPDGLVIVEDGEWSVEAIGVRHTAVNGDLLLRPDRTVDIAISSQGIGTSEVTGTVLLEPFRDPGLDLTVSFDGFSAVSRPDIEGLISGELALGGSYLRPVAEGSLTLDQGAIYVDEFRRAADVVDLSDPFLFGRGIAVDTTALIVQPLLLGMENPFFDNLRVNVDLAVPGDTWLRSIETNVEMSGDLLVRYDRSVGDFVLTGELEAVRGSHVVLGRTFDLDGGAVSFIGRPGLNPDLSIQASSRIRRPDDPPLDITADLAGTLVQPVVTLASPEAGLAQADLVSYLIFGQASGAPGSDAVQSGLVTNVMGAIVNQYGSVLGRGLGVLSLDYVSVQQGNQVQGLGQVLGGQFGLSGAQVELGRYIGDDVFVVMVIRGRGAELSSDTNLIRGVRVEVAVADEGTLELLWEDRFLRSGGNAFGAAGLVEGDRVLGFVLFREWGFSPNRDP